jgi:hypothetical protein
MDDKKREYVEGILNKYTPYTYIGIRVHVLYKQSYLYCGEEIPEIMLPDGTIVISRNLVYCGLDNTVKYQLLEGYTYLGIGVVHKMVCNVRLR